MKDNEKLLLAVLSGDNLAADGIRDEINSRNSTDRKRSVTISLKPFAGDYTPVLDVFRAMVKYLGEDWFNWEFETIWRMLKINNIEEPRENIRDCIMALKIFMTTTSVENNWDHFNNAALAFSGSIADFEAIRSPSAGSMISAVKTMQYLKPDMELSEEVKKIICIQLRQDGIILPPPSIIHYINDEMIDELSIKIRKIWPDVYREYNDILEGKDVEPEADYHIQAMRIYKAEMAAKYFYGGSN